LLFTSQTGSAKRRRRRRRKRDKISQDIPSQQPSPPGQ